jgi:hypothetical protein
VKGKKIANGEITADARLLNKSLSNVLRGLDMANSDPALRLAYRLLLEFLSSNDNQKLVFGRREIGEHKSHSTVCTVDDDLASLSIEDLEKILSTDDVSKAYLSKIAAIRFSVTRGALSKLSREALHLKLRNLVENEKTHQTISRVASSSD